MYGIFMKAGSFIKTGTIKKVSPNYFTGKASLQIISGTPKPKEADVLHVKFHKGARTKIHAHTGSYTRETECMWIWLFFGLRRVVPNCEVFFESTNRVASSKVILRKSTKIFVIFFMPNVRCSSY